MEESIDSVQSENQKNNQFFNHVSLITGASGGIGSAVARALSACGASVIMTGRSEEKLKKIQAEIQTNLLKINKSAFCRYIIADVNDPNNIAPLFKEVNSPLNSLIYCAGIAPTLPLNLTKPKNLLETFNVNYFSFVEAARLFCKQKFTAENMGSIVSIASIAARCLDKGRVAYASSKIALEASTKIIAKEVVNRNIRVNAIRCALVNTAMASDFLDEVNGVVSNVQPLGIIDPLRDAASLILYLLSDKSSKITGSVFEINGGYI